MNKADEPAMALAVAQERERNERLLAQHCVVSEEEWLKQRLALMEREKQYVRQGDALSAEVRSLPWVKVEKDYLFTSPDGDLTLKDLFRGHSQLFLKHFMFCWVSSCKSEFNYDFHVSFRPEEVAAGMTMYNFREKKIGPETFTLSGHSVFYKNAQGEIFRTYGTFGRGSEQFMGIYGYFDVLPRGREEYVHGLVDWAKVGVQSGITGHEGACGCTRSS
jgi:predicted dithiol-disulfide oxidoreductase (DUF899 family)